MISEREKAFFNSWKVKREMGKWKFGIIHGALFWGIPTYGFMQFYYLLFKDGYEFEFARFATGLIIWMICGFLAFGLITWWLNERAYHKIKVKNPDA